MKVLIVGSGGREHGLAWKAMSSPLVENVFVAPGNAGTDTEVGLENVPIDANDIDGLVQFAKQNDIGLTIVGPEDPLVNGIVDVFSQAGLNCFGPTKAAAQLEGSKTFSKAFLAKNQIPTASYRSFVDVTEAIDYLESVEFPIVIKADGLAAGKGVIIAGSLSQARSAVQDMLSENRFGSAGSQVVIEAFLKGEEASFICMVDGTNILPMATSQDHKAAYDGDLGPNTGGMGAYSPAPVVDDKMHDIIMEKVMIPTVEGLKAQGIHYVGFLYAGLMIDNGDPKVLEFNCRFGDPETQPIMMRMKSDIVAHCLAAIEGRLDQESAEWDPRSALGVVIASQGYPGEYAKGNEISGLPMGNSEQDSAQKVFHAGTTRGQSGVVTAGGRVLCATALGEDIKAAQIAAYSLAESVSWKGSWYRKDIGFKAINR